MTLSVVLCPVPLWVATWSCSVTPSLCSRSLSGDALRASSVSRLLPPQLSPPTPSDSGISPDRRARSETRCYRSITGLVGPSPDSSCRCVSTPQHPIPDCHPCPFLCRCGAGLWRCARRARNLAFRGVLCVVSIGSDARLQRTPNRPWSVPRALRCGQVPARLRLAAGLARVPPHSARRSSSSARRTHAPDSVPGVALARLDSPPGWRVLARSRPVVGARRR